MSSLPAPSPDPAWKADALSLYRRPLSAPFWEQLQARTGVRQNDCVHTFRVVMWLMIAQRLQSMASLETAVLGLLRGLPASFWPQPCKRLQDWRRGHAPLSSHTGAYNKARQALPTTVVEPRWDEKAGSRRDALSSQLDTHSKCKGDRP